MNIIISFVVVEGYLSVN